MNKQRTPTQNNSMWRYFTLVSAALNNAGLSLQEVLKHYRMEIEWDKDLIHDVIWVPVQKAKFKKKSTRDLKKQGEIDVVYEHVNRFLSKLGVHVPFPHDPDKQKEKQYTTEKSHIAYP
ncbi:MAG: hypothetical protein WAV09_03580, partial [Minisyncoccia bacterium]